MNEPLEPMFVARRAGRARAQLAALELDLLVVTNGVNVRWLTGFTGSNALVLLGLDDLWLFTDARYTEQASAQLDVAGVEASVVIGPDLLGELLPRVGDQARLGLEVEHVSWAVQRRVSEAIEVEPVPVPGLLEGLRAQKDPGELARSRRAAQIADDALAQVVPRLADGPSEREVALALDHAMRAGGATGNAYETIVASGPNGALPHARPTDRRIQRGDLVIIDVGAIVDGYRSDMTRTFVIGEPSAEQQRRLDVVEEAQAAGVAAVRAGTEVKVVDKACRDVVAAAGWLERFSHGAGHGVGLDIHELPRVNARSDEVLAAGMVVTVEPGVYFTGDGGVRWEDLLHVTDQGSEVLTGSPKAPVVAS